MNIDRRYILAHKEMKQELCTSLKQELRELTPHDVMPYGLFMPTIPSLLPPHADEDDWTVTKGSIYIAPDGTVVHITQGDKTDLASTPRIGKLIFGGPGRETPGAVVHDNGYSKVGKERYNIFMQEAWVPPQKWWDQTFKDCMYLCKTNRLKIHTYYRMLRMFGFVAWKNYRRKAKKEKI